VDPQWRKSTKSQSNGQCVEVADLAQSVAVRDSKDKTGPTLAFNPESWKAFVSGLKSDR